MEKFGIFNMLEQFGALFKNEERKPPQNSASPPTGKSDKTENKNGHDIIPSAPVIYSQMNAASLEKFILNHEEISRRIDRQNSPK